MLIPYAASPLGSFFFLRLVEQQPGFLRFALRKKQTICNKEPLYVKIEGQGNRPPSFITYLLSDIIKFASACFLFLYQIFQAHNDMQLAAFFCNFLLNIPLRN